MFFSSSFSSDLPLVACLQFQESPLHDAAREGHAKTCEFLLGKGAVVNTQNEVKNKVPLRLDTLDNLRC